MFSECLALGVAKYRILSNTTQKKYIYNSLYQNIPLPFDTLLYYSIIAVIVLKEPKWENMPVKPSWMEWEYRLDTVMRWYYLWWNQAAVKGLTTTVPQQHCSCYLTFLQQDSMPVKPLSLSRALLSNCLGDLFLAPWSPSSHKKSFSSFLTLINVCSSLGQNAQRWVPMVIWSIVQISQVWRGQSKCYHIVGKRTNGTNVQERHEKLLWNNAQGWEVLTRMCQEAKFHNKAWYLLI